jgi:hypothetical protein
MLKTKEGRRGRRGKRLKMPALELEIDLRKIRRRRGKG